MAAKTLSTDTILLPEIVVVSQHSPRLKNVMIGRLSDRGEDHIYLVDTYPLVYEKEYFREIELDVFENSWAAVIESLHEKAHDKYDFPLSHNALRDFLVALESWREENQSPSETPPVI